MKEFAIQRYEDLQARSSSPKEQVAAMNEKEKMAEGDQGSDDSLYTTSSKGKGAKGVQCYNCDGKGALCPRLQFGPQHHRHSHLQWGVEDEATSSENVPQRVAEVRVRETKAARTGGYRESQWGRPRAGLKAITEGRA